MPGTDLAYVPTRSYNSTGVKTRGPPGLKSPISMVHETIYRPTRCPLLTYSMVLELSLGACYAISDTDPGYGAAMSIQCPVLAQRMLLQRAMRCPVLTWGGAGFETPSNSMLSIGSSGGRRGVRSAVRYAPMRVLRDVRY
eukprot:2600904-Rhodomonas_salina.5